MGTVRYAKHTLDVELFGSRQLGLKAERTSPLEARINTGSRCIPSASSLKVAYYF